MTELDQDPEELSEEDFTCTCCCELLLDPTTLTCGHTFCRFCLANWWRISRKTECLQCRRPFNEFPNVNFTLRNTIERLCPLKLEVRRQAENSIPNYKSIIAAFQDHVESDRNSANERRANGNFGYGTVCILVSIVIAIIVLIVVVMRTLFGGSDVLVNNKLISEWTTDDVAYWVGEQGIWAKGYGERFKEAKIDGPLLLMLKEEDLESEPINMNLGLHRRVFMVALRTIGVGREAKPGDFWQFKAANRAKSLFLLFGLRQFPRTMLLYLYLFDYQDTFLPFLQRTCPSTEFNSLGLEDSNIAEKKPTWEQHRQFITWAMITPYYLIGYLAYDYLTINYWISRVVILHTFAMGCCELSQVIWLTYRKGYKTLPGMMLTNFIFILGASLVLKLLWPFVPSFICDLVFSWMFFISPFEAFNKLFKRFIFFRTAWRDRDVEPDHAGDNPRFQFDFRIRRQ